jgi:hydroxypyruvate isomerase
MSKINLSAPDWCFFKPHYKPDDYYQTLARIGYAGVEMVDPARQRAAQAAGLSIVNMSGPGMTEGLNRAENHPTLIPALTAAIEEAGRNGIGQLIVFSGNTGGQDRAAGLDNCISALKLLATHAQKHRVTLAFEMLNTFDHPGYMADHSAFGFDIVKAIASPCVKVLYDIYHMHRMGEDVMEDLADNLPHIAHLHIAGSPKRDFPGADQQIDYAKIVRLLISRGYAGSWGMEFIPSGDSLDELEKAARLFQSYAAR